MLRVIKRTDAGLLSAAGGLRYTQEGGDPRHDTEADRLPEDDDQKQRNIARAVTRS